MEGPLHLSPKAIAELKAIWRRDVGEVLSDQDVDRMGMRLLRLLALLARPSKSPKPEVLEKFEPPSG